MIRKQFIEKMIISSGGALILSTALFSCEKENTIPESGLIIDLSEAKNSNLQNPDGFIYIQGIIVANAGNNQFIALSQTCTHEGCTVTFNLVQNRFPCPCHGSVFSATGSVLQGPATTSLKKYDVTTDGDKLIIK